MDQNIAHMYGYHLTMYCSGPYGGHSMQLSQNSLNSKRLPVKKNVLKFGT